MPVTILEKFVYTVPVVLLHLDACVPATSCGPHWSIPFLESVKPDYGRVGLILVRIKS
jgi:hypothetical protein